MVIPIAVRVLAAVLLLCLPLMGESELTEASSSPETNLCGTIGTKQVDMRISARGVFGGSFLCGEPCLGSDNPCRHFESPRGSDIEYLFMGSLWVGGIVGSDTIVSTGAPGWLADYEISPARRKNGEQPGVQAIRSVASTSLRAHMTDARLFDGGANPTPLGVELTLRSHVWDSSALSKAVIHDLVITNVSDHDIRDGVLGLYFDCDVGLPYRSEDAVDDITGSLPEHQIGYVIDNNGNPGETAFQPSSPRRCFAAKFLATSFEASDPTYNWWTSNTYFELDYGPQLDDENYRIFSHLGTGTPILDPEFYYVMAKPEWDFDQFFIGFTDSLDQAWVPPSRFGNWLEFGTGNDSRFLLSIGPFDLLPDSSARVIFTTFTGVNVHQDPYILDLLPDHPTAYREALNFDDVIAVANAAKGAVDSLLTAKAPVTGLEVYQVEGDKTELSWDPYVFAGLDGYDIYLDEVDPSLLPYPGSCPPWLRPENGSRIASIPPAKRYRLGFALRKDRFYLAQVAQRNGDTLGMPSETVIYRATERSEPPIPRLSSRFFQPGDSVQFSFERPPQPVDHYNVYLLPTFDDADRVYHPFYDQGEATDSLQPVDSFAIDGATYYYYAMQPVRTVDGRAAEFKLGDLPDSGAVMLTAVDAAGFESEFSKPYRLYEVPPRDRDVIVMTRGIGGGQQAAPDSITAFYDRLLAGLDYDIYVIADSTTLPRDWPWWSVLIPYRLAIIDGDLIDRVLFNAPLQQLENYALSGGHLVVCGSLFENSEATFITRTHGWYTTDTTARRLLGIDSLYAIGIRYYADSTSPPLVDSLGGFVAATTPGTGTEVIRYDPGRDPLTTQIRAFWPSETAPIVTAFAVTEGTRTELLYRSLYPGQSRLHGRPVAVSRDHGLGTISTAGFHLWYLEPAGIYHWLPELTEKRGGNDGKEPESALPHTLALAPNYPNPFNPVTTIEFSLPAAGEATVTIYNVLGQEVERLVHSRLAAGSYTVTWDGAAYSSGVYFYRLETAELSISRKMLLVK